MRNAATLTILIALAATIPGSACISHLGDDCRDRNCDATGGSTSQGGNGGQGGGTPAECIPADTDTPVSNDCGVFVSSSRGDDANPGTKEDPFATIGAAITAAGDGEVYVCAEAFSEAVTLPSGTSLFGGLDCANGWAYTASKAQLTADADTIPLTLAPGSSDTRIEDFAITAQSATVDGGSSIAVLGNGATASIARCELMAGNGVAGPSGESPSVVGLDGENAQNGSWIDTGGGETCNPDATTTFMGGPGGIKMCGAAIVSGGKGGDSTNGDNGDPGDDGLPLGTMGQGGMGKVDGGSACQPGGPGEGGTDGSGGLGATGVGALDASGYVAPIAEVGAEGGHGQGGGGGGGSHECENGSVFFGPSGGGGGSGGCGGPGGGGGGGGGGSFALISVNATLTITASTLQAGNGANGGVGGDGQNGGNPGNNGDAPNVNSCDGGVGGQGGRGGGGGGGLGGHSAAIAEVGSTLDVDDETMLVVGTAGMGGLGGTGAPGLDGTPGGNGTAVETLAFE